jgi:hypothetical protein
MWVSRREFEALQRDLADLRKRHEELANNYSREIEPFRVGDLPDWYLPSCWNYPLRDPRPSVSLRKAIDLIREHLKLNFKQVNAVPERIEIEKVKA